MLHATSYFKVYKTVGEDGDVAAWIIPHFLGNHLWEDADVLGRRWRDRRKSGFLGLDGALSGIAAVDMWQN